MCGGLLLAIGVLLLAFGGGPASNNKGRTNDTGPAVNLAPPRPEAREIPEEPPARIPSLPAPASKTDSGPPDRPPRETSAEDRAAGEFERLKRYLAQRGAAQFGEKKAALGSYLKEYGTSSYGDRARALLAELEQRAPAEVPEPGPAQPAPAAPEVSARAVYEKLHASALAQLGRGQTEPAARQFKAALDDARLAAFHKALALDAGLVEALAELDAAASRGAALLLEKQPRIKLARTGGQALETGPGANAAVTGFKDGQLTITQTLGKGASAELKWALSELTPETRSALVKLGLERTQDAQAKLAFAQLVALAGGAQAGEADLEAVAARLEEAQAAGNDAALCAHLTERLQAWRRAQDARKAAAQLQASVAAGNWKDAAALIERCRAEWADTPAVQELAPRFEAWMKQAREAALTSNGSVDAAWRAAIAAMPPEEQAKYVMAKMQALNPKMTIEGYKTGIRDGKVTALRFNGGWVNDTAPLAALPDLEVLNCDVLSGHEGRLDLAPLGSLAHLRVLEIYNTRAVDLAPLKGSRIEALNIQACRIADYAPLVELPALKQLKWDLKPSAEAGALVRRMKTLERLNGKPLDEFLKACP
ncbi:MAG: hypothetical protein M5U26_04795 [Planctomycetota bacterium]|nr:hypothetical protein [Planctomycetota bacterium]